MRVKGKKVRLSKATRDVNMVKLARKLLKMPAKPLVLRADTLLRAVSSRVKQYVIKCRYPNKHV